MSGTLVVGPGRVGRALALAHRRAGESVLLLGRSAGPWQTWAEQAGVRTALGNAAAPESAACVLLTVADDDLQSTAATLASQCRAELVLHTSGLHGLEVLGAAADHGAAVAALHPILPFAEDAEASLRALAGAPASLLAGTGAEAPARAVAAVWGCRVVVVGAAVDRRRYQLGMAIAANHVTSLLGWAEDLLLPSLGDEARDVVAAIARSAVDAFADRGAGAALTGPAARGDHAAVTAHLQALDAVEAARYRALLEPVVSLALQAGRIDAAQAQAVRDAADAFENQARS